MNTRQEELLSEIKKYALMLLISVKDYLKESFNIYIGKYGVLGAVSAFLVIAKIIVFYLLMGTSSHFISVCLITLIFIYLLFKSTDNKWIPAVIFSILSVLMFCDVTYSSFFNRYLSVGMLGAAEVVGDIGESIKEVLRPVNFFMLVDAVLIIVMLVLKKKSDSGSNCKDSGRCETDINTENPVDTEFNQDEEDDIFSVFDSLAAEEQTEIETSEGEKTAEDEASEPKNSENDEVHEDEHDTVGTEYWESTGSGKFVITENTASQNEEACTDTENETEISASEEAGAEAEAEESFDVETGEEKSDVDDESEGAESEDGLVAEDTKIGKLDVAECFAKAAEMLKPFLKDAGRILKTAYKKAVAVTNPKAIAAFILIAVFTTTNIFNSSYITSLTNQEFFSFHIKDIFTGAFADGTSENLAAWTKSYEQEKDGPLFGAAKDKNLIIIQVESLQDFVIGREYNGQEITPNLNALIENNATYFDNFYQQVGSGNTSDAEFAVNNSLYGTLVSYTYKLFNENYFRGLPVQLSEIGYDTAVFHAHEDRSFWSRESMYPSEGFNRYYGGLKGRGGDYEMTEWMGWGLTDSEFFPQTVEYMKELSEPFYSFVISISNHHPYEMLNKYKFINLAREDRNTIVGKYLQSAAYTDYALGVFFDELKEAGLYDNSLFVIYGDHTGLSHSDEIDTSMEKILGKPYDYEEMLKIPLIIYSPDESIDLKGTIMTAGGETDIMPTVAYLMGIEELDTIYTGHNLYTIEEGFVAEQTYMTKGSFFTNDIAYEMSRDGVFENGRAWNIHTGAPVDISSCYEGYLRSVDIVNTSEYVLRSDAIRRIFKDGESIGNVDSVKISRIYPDEIVYAGYPDEELIGTNSVAALNYSAYAGKRSVRLDVYWNEKSQPYTINNKTGEVEMEYDDIIEWMENHAGVDLYMNMEKSADFMLQFCGELSPATLDRIILEVPNAEEYTGRYEAVLDLNSAGLSYENALEFIKSNKVWAAVMSKEDSEGRFSKLLGGDVTIYINDEDAGIITKVN
ncbi:MAG: sulfatase-like hydrolase/transferase [Firmicutes bacterium]|nr:sulfatase-like hydrolase/transferase [Bacillota bacterium]